MGKQWTPPNSDTIVDDKSWTPPSSDEEVKKKVSTDVSSNGSSGGLMPVKLTKTAPTTPQSFTQTNGSVRKDKSWENLGDFVPNTVLGGLQKDAGQAAKFVGDNFAFSDNNPLSRLGARLEGSGKEKQAKAAKLGLPDTVAGTIASEVTKFGPDLLELALTPELDVAKLGKLSEVLGKTGTKIAQVATGKFPTLMATKGLTSRFVGKKQAGASDYDAMKSALGNMGEEYMKGVLFEGAGKVAGKASDIGKKLMEDNGWMTDGKIVSGAQKAILNSSAQATAFSAVPFITNAVQGKSTSIKELQDNAIFGGVLGLFHGSGEKEGEHTAADGASAQIVERAPLIDLHNFANADIDAIKEVHEMPENASDLKIKSAVGAEQAFKAETPEEKQQAIVQSSTDGKAASVKTVTDAILKDKDAVIDAIPEDLPNRQELVDKINEVHKSLDPVEKEKTNLSEQIQQLDEQLKKEPADPIESAEQELLKGKRTELNNQLKSIIQKQQEHETSKTSINNAKEKESPESVAERPEDSSEKGDGQGNGEQEEKAGNVKSGGDEPPVTNKSDEQGVGDTETAIADEKQPDKAESKSDTGETVIEPTIGQETKSAKEKEEPIDATKEGGVTESGESKHKGTTQGENVSENGKQVREEKSGQTGSSDSAEPKEEKQIKIPAPIISEDGKEVGLVKNEKGAVYQERHKYILNKLGYSDEEINKLPQKDLDNILLNNIENPKVVSSYKVTPKESKEIVPDESGLNKASVAENRRVIGLKDVNKPEKLEGDQEYRKAAEKVRNGSLHPYEIAERIIRTRETPTIEEFHAMLYQNRVIDNQYDEALAKIDEAEKGEDSATTEDARNQLLVLEKNKDLLHNAARNVSYNWGFMGRMLQEAVKKDYTLSNLRSLFRAKSDGKIPEDIEAKLTQYVKERDEAVKALQDYQTKEAERSAQVRVDRERRSSNRKVATEKLDKAIEDTFASISKKLKAQRATLSMNPIPVEMLPDIGKLVSYYTQKGVIKATDIADNIYSRLKDDIDGLSKKDVIDAMAGNGYQKETKSLDEMQKQKADIKMQAKLISRLEDLESGKVQPSILRSKRAISDEVAELREKIKKASIEQGIPLANLKKNLQTKLEDLEQTIKKIQSGEIEAPQKVKPYRTEPDQEALRLKAKVKRAEKLIDELGANLDQRRETNINKFLDGYIKLHRFFILSRIGTLAKLRSAAMGRQLITPIEEALGAINKELPGFKKIAERSPRFSNGFNISAEVKASSEHYTKATIADNNQVLKEGHGELDYLFDPKAQKETEMAGFPGRLHAWIKNSTKRAEFQRSFQHIMEWEKRNNPDLDVNGPTVQERVGKDAYNEARRSIFMNDNMAVDLYNNVLQFAERSWGVTGKGVATALRALMPIVKIPTNFALEAADYATAGTRLFANPAIYKAVFKGAESLSPKEADFVMRMLRKGQLGVAMMAIAYLHPENFGGYYIPGEKRNKNDLKVGDFKVGGVKIPHLLQHIPLLSAMQAAATVSRTREINVSKGKEGGTPQGVLNGFKGIIENVPFLSAPSEISEALQSGNAFNSYIGQMVKNQFEPGAVQEIAEQTDTKDKSIATINPDNTNKRYPDTKSGLGTSIKENLKAGIPGLREQLSSEKSNDPLKKKLSTITNDDGDKEQLPKQLTEKRKEIYNNYLSDNPNDWPSNHQNKQKWTHYFNQDWKADKSRQKKDDAEIKYLKTINRSAEYIANKMSDKKQEALDKYLQQQALDWSEGDIEKIERNNPTFTIKKK